MIPGHNFALELAASALRRRPRLDAPTTTWAPRFGPASGPPDSEAPTPKPHRPRLAARRGPHALRRAAREHPPQPFPTAPLSRGLSPAVVSSLSGWPRPSRDGRADFSSFPL